MTQTIVCISNSIVDVQSSELTLMLPRVLETEYMDTADEARDYDAMDHSTVNQRFVDDLIRHGGGVGNLLDLGTGTAQIPILLVQQCDDCRVVAVDAALHMLDLARLNLEMAGQIERVQLQHCDAKQLPFPDDLFDGVISNSIVHHIPEPESVLRDAVRVVKKGGLIFFRDLVRPDDEESLESLVQQYTGQESPHAQQMFRDSLHAALTVEEVQAIVSKLGLSSHAVSLTSDRHWTWCDRV